MTLPAAHNPPEYNLDLSLHLSTPPVPATMPPESRGLARDAVKMLVIHKDTGATEHTSFCRIGDVLRAGDVLVVNTSKTLPASLQVLQRHNGAQMILHVAAQVTAHGFIVERRTALDGPDDAAFGINELLDVIGGQTGQAAAQLAVMGRYHPNSRFWYVESDADLWAVSRHVGQPIRYGYLQEAVPLKAFQTIFARDGGSAEMPSAARPFSHRVVRDLAMHGVKLATVTLHTGVSSQEVTDGLENHPFLPEWYRVPAATARVINDARAHGGRIIAVGTTVVRALESAALAGVDGVDGGQIVARSGWTMHVVTPHTPPRVATGLLTGFHDNDTSHLAMLYAFVQDGWLRSAYEEAIARGYLWHEFGDINLIL